jgi:hypothetical protein
MIQKNRNHQRFTAVGLAVAMLLAVPGIARGASDGTVPGTVRINIAGAPTACITLSAVSLTFADPITHLSPASGISTGTASSGSPLSMTSCSASTLSVSGSTSNATSGSVTWVPQDVIGQNQANKYQLSVGAVLLATVPKPMFGIGPSITQDLNPIVFRAPAEFGTTAIPPVGTDMTFTLTFTAALP